MEDKLNKLQRQPKGLRMQTRLSLAFSVLLALLLAVSVVALQRFDSLTASLNILVDDQSRMVFLAQRANQQAQSAAIQLLWLLQTSTRDERVPHYLAMDAALAASDDAVAALERAQGAAAFQELIALRHQYGEVIQATVEQIEIGGLEPARRHFDAHTEPVLEQLLQQTLHLAEQQREVMQAEVVRLGHQTDDARTLIVALAGGALLLGVLLAVAMSRGIVLPLRQAEQVAGAVAGGDYDCEIPQVQSREVGGLLRALQVMRDSIAQREERIYRLAYVDSLTGLTNRTGFLEVFDERVSKGQGALGILDLNRFAQINNALGYPVGDRLLQEVATRLKRVVKSPELVARLDSDEFGLLLSSNEPSVVLAQIEALMRALREPILIDQQRLDIDASIGIALFPQDGNTTTALLKRADLALKAAKKRHDNYAFGAEFQQPLHQEHLALLGELREALQRDEFVVEYQPKLALADGRIKGVEALLRWEHPQRGRVPPGLFIPFAEQTGFIREITPWVVERTIRDAAQWYRDGLGLVVSVNISTLDLVNPQLVTQVEHALAQTGLPAGQLCLEITESALMNDPELALQHLHRFAERGVRLSIDDYGSGQASLAYVKNLPVDELKIDRAFVSHVDQSPKNAAIVRSTLLLCRELGLSVVAEGVETEAELAWLRQHQCDLVQGFGIARPMPAAQLMRWLSNHHTGAGKSA